MNTSKTVLVADDEAAVRAILARCLAEDGMRVVTVADGPAALKAVEANTPDVVVLDFDMPGMNGADVCRALRRDSSTRSVPVVMLTGSTDGDTEVGSLQAGADRFIAKPVNPRRLKAQIDSLIDRSSRLLEANPLTGLPGNRAIGAEFQRRTSMEERFWLYHVDIRNFKAFNDAYGFAAGDGLLAGTARLLTEAARRDCDPRAFAGHVGGDDFVFMTAHRLDRRALDAGFAALAGEALDDAAAEAGWFWAQDRDGRHRRFPKPTLSVGAVFSRPEAGRSFRQASAVATQKKEEDKRVSAREVML